MIDYLILGILLIVGIILVFSMFYQNNEYKSMKKNKVKITGQIKKIEKSTIINKLYVEFTYGKKVFNHIFKTSYSAFEIGDKYEFYYDKNNGKVMDISIFEHKDKYEKNSIVIYLFASMLILPPILIVCGIDNIYSFFVPLIVVLVNSI